MCAAISTYLLLWYVYEFGLSNRFAIYHKDPNPYFGIGMFAISYLSYKTLATAFNSNLCDVHSPRFWKCGVFGFVFSVFYNIRAHEVDPEGMDLPEHFPAKIFLGMAKYIGVESLNPVDIALGVVRRPLDALTFICAALSYMVGTALVYYFVALEGVYPDLGILRAPAFFFVRYTSYILFNQGRKTSLTMALYLDGMFFTLTAVGQTFFAAQTKSVLDLAVFAELSF